MKVSKKVPAIAYTILCVFLLLGLVAGIKYIVDFGDKLEDTNFNSKEKINWDSNSNDSNFSSSEIVDDNGQKIKPLSASVTSYEIDIPYGDILITQTDKDPYLTYDSKRNIEILTLEDNEDNKLKISAKMNFLDGLKIGGDDVKINIYLPKNVLKKLEVDFSAGILKISNIKADEFSLGMAAGNAIVKNCEFGTIKTELDAGNLELYTNTETRSIDSDVSAGNMKLMLPKDIKGFDLGYQVDVGNIKNNLSFNIESSKEGIVVGKTGKFLYGDKSCKINLDVSVGNISINEY